MPSKRRRINIGLPEILDKWLQEESKASGVSQSSIILTCIAKVKEQQEAMKFMSKLSKDQIDKVLDD